MLSGAYQAKKTEVILAGLGIFISISLVTWISFFFANENSPAFLVASMGTSVILVFVTPDSPLSQPWPVFGGNIISATISVFLFSLIVDPIIVIPLIVTFSFIVMYFLRCLHPPAAATGLFAVLGGESLHQLGFFYVLSPVLLNVLILLCASVVIINLIPGRCYPASIKNRGWKKNGGA